jgi:hypothetical protein
MTVLSNTLARVFFGTYMALLALLMPFATRAQEPQPVSPTAEITKPYTFYSESRQIIVAATVFKKTDKDGAASWVAEESLNRLPNGEAAAVRKLGLPPARGLSAKDFRLLDNGAEQSINYFQEADFPAVDITGHWAFSPTFGGTWGITFRSLAVVPPVATYLIGYVPRVLNPGECRTLEASVEGYDVHLNRTRYCRLTNSDGLDGATLEGTTLGARMRSFADSPAHGSVEVSTKVFTFWSSRVMSLARETPPTGNHPVVPAADFTYLVEVHDAKAPATVQIATEYALPKGIWDCRKNNPALHVLGMVYRATGQVAGQFAAAGACPDSRVVVSNRFDTQIELTPGEYELRVVVSDGKNFGRARVPLRVGAFDGQRLMISDVVFGGVLRDASWVVREAADVSPAPITPSPLVSNKVQFFPATDTSFPRSDHLPLYFEIYEPQRVDQSMAISFRLRVTDLKTGSVVEDMERINAADWIQPGHVVIPVGMKLPTDKLKKGSYQLEVQAFDSAGRVSDWRQATFTLDGRRSVNWR